MKTRKKHSRPGGSPFKKLGTLLDLCMSSLRRGHANLLCIVPILSDDPRRESSKVIPQKQKTVKCILQFPQSKSSMNLWKNMENRNICVRTSTFVPNSRIRRSRLDDAPSACFCDQHVQWRGAQKYPNNQCRRFARLSSRFVTNFPHSWWLYEMHVFQGSIFVMTRCIAAAACDETWSPYARTCRPVVLSWFWPASFPEPFPTPR